MTSVCRLFEELPIEIREKVVPALVELAYRELAEVGRVDEAYAILATAVARGYDSKLREVKEILDKVIELGYQLRDLNNLVQKILRAEDVTQLDLNALRVTRSRIEELLNELSNVLDEDTKNTIRKALGYSKDIEKLFAPLKKYREIMHRVKELEKELPQIFRANILDIPPEKIAWIAASISKTVRDLDALANELSSISCETDEGAKVKFELLSRINTVRSKLDRFARFCDALASLIEGLYNFSKLMERYGSGTNVLSNPSYADSLKHHLAVILRSLKEFENLAEEGGYPDEIYSASITLLTNIKQWLDSLKEDLSYTDLRFVVLFDEAEREAGFELKDVSPYVESWLEFLAKKAEEAGYHDIASALKSVHRALVGGIEAIGNIFKQGGYILSSSAIDFLASVAEAVGRHDDAEKLRKVKDVIAKAVAEAMGVAPRGIATLMIDLPRFEKFMNTAINMGYEQAQLALHSNDALNQALGAVGNALVAICDALTTIFRPHALAQQIEALAEIGKIFGNEISRKGLQGIPSALQRIGSMMFRDPSDIARFIGFAIAGLIAGKIATRVFPRLSFWSRIARVTLENVIQGDPLGLMVGVLSEVRPRLKSSIKVRIVKASKYADIITDPKMSKVVSKYVLNKTEDYAKKLLQKYMRRTLTRSLESLANVLATAITKARDATEAIVKAREIAKNFDAETLINLQRKYLNVIDEIGKLLDIDRLLNKVSKEFKIPKDVKVPKIEIPTDIGKIGVPELKLKSIVSTVPFETLAEIGSKLVESFEKLNKAIGSMREILEEIASRYPELSSKLRSIIESLKVEEGIAEKIRTLLNAIESIRTVLEQELGPEVRKVLGEKIGSIMEELKRAEELYRSGKVSDAYAILDRIKNEVRELEKKLSELRPPNFEQVISRIKKIASEHGLTDLAEKIEKARNLVELQNTILDYFKKALDEYRRGYSDKLREFLSTLRELKTRHPEVEHLLTTIASRINKVLATELRGSVVDALVAKKLFERLSKIYEKLEKSNPELADKIAKDYFELVSKLREGRVDFESVKKFAEKLKEVSGYARVATDYTILRSLAESLEEALKILMARWKASEVLCKQLSELLSKVVDIKGTIIKMYEMHGAPLGLIEGLKELVAIAPEAFPDLANRITSVLNRVIEVLSKGEKIPKELVEEIETIAREVKSRAFPVHKSVAEKLLGLCRKLESLVSKETVLGKEFLEAFTDLFEAIRRNVIEIPDGYAIVELMGTEVVGRPRPLILCDEAMRAEIEKFLSTEDKGVFSIAGTRFAFKRVPMILPDGTVKIMWIIADEQGRKATVIYEAKPAGREWKKPWYVRVKQAVMILIDPELEKAHPELVKEMSKGIEFLYEIDPKARLLNKIVVITPSGTKNVARALNVALKMAGTSLYATSLAMRGKIPDANTAIYIYSLAADKKSFLEDMRRNAIPVTDEERKAFEEKGLIPLFKIPLPSAPGFPRFAFVVFPTDRFNPKDLERRVFVFEWKGEKVIAPIIPIPGIGKVPIIPCIDIDVPQLRDVSEAQLTAVAKVQEISQKQIEEEIEELKERGAPTPSPQPVAVPTPFRLPRLAPPAVGLAIVRSEGKGRQFEILVL